MRETKNLDISINTFNFKNCNNFQINQTIILTSELAETDVKVVAIEDIEEKAKKLEVLASVMNIVATISPIVLPFFMSITV
ncbi:hypothetical protein I6J32_01345 [Moraxella osloensis]|uniref:Uncharacterized protein n=1 Tax=Faucicola osloensis TaxID=34062 RepID=A0AA91J9E0_FAUOS|nr:hypothetical protein [Moraxella osloensis]OBX62568.1 hypothetical protein A9299_05165 [Moraxella osloensis]QRO13555.1 hypothetical protein I6J32_01345 [Moraxella osloensis]